MKAFLKFLLMADLGFLLGGELAILQAHHGFSAAAPKAAAVGTVKSVPDPDAKEHIGGPFSLVDQTGRAVTEKSWPGKYKLVYFGFTHCDDTCPATLQKIADVLQRLAPAAAAKVVPLFITVDPARDGVMALAEYLLRFHSPALVGLTGTAAQIAAAEKTYHVYAGGKGTPESHSSYVYLMSPDDTLAQVFDQDISAADLQAGINKYVK
ncbi:MAG: SCO family protein [Alphaproteobacteria bacterium]|nr:SCO family protein [Alphaproteobacteria bacterium]